MNLFLHTPNSENNLTEIYQRAFNKAEELFVVTAYLTAWDSSLVLNDKCQRFRLIIGKDFGITKKEACRAVMKCLPPERKAQFLVADLISGFHPKAMFWKESNSQYFALVGSSNLTLAAFESNYEANTFFELKEVEYMAAEEWIASIEKQSVPVSEDWLDKYVEARQAGCNDGKNNKSDTTNKPIAALKLPTIRFINKLLDARRRNLKIYQQHRKSLIDLFTKCAYGEITSARFYEQLPQYWSHEVGDRLQGNGWERKGASGNFREVASSYLSILNASSNERDDVVSREIDRLKQLKEPARKAFFSEMLCLEFPDKYPVLNAPVKSYLRAMKYRAPRNASEGAQYADLAIKLRASLAQNRDYPAQSLAELDTVIWHKYSKKKR